jgi:POT family proton-dependent oligopeptide transporter
VFWAGFEQTATSLNFFAQNRTDRMFGSFQVPASWFQSVNPVVLVIAAPAFAALWTALARRDRQPSTPVKMALALVLMAVGFLFMVMAARAGSGGKLVSPWWLVAAYSFHTFGELCLSPIGLSFVSKLAPVKMVGLLMGLWYLATAIAEFIAGQLAALKDSFSTPASFFLLWVIVPVIAAGVLLALTPWLRPRMHGRDV